MNNKWKSMLNSKLFWNYLHLEPNGIFVFLRLSKEVSPRPIAIIITLNIRFFVNDQQPFVLIAS